ncbi:hypothetical protein FB550_101129 [Neobacillus bataviensis]|uniref:Uncharacterized protein n=1 Tax=Neobacillus bataviensis TaxID=220685 RepID=A0A561DXL9_9BACI|nr:hypothetical protein FB550_101129 [Neobacillus bataviensis]
MFVKQRIALFTLKTNNLTPFFHPKNDFFDDVVHTLLNNQSYFI